MFANWLEKRLDAKRCSISELAQFLDVSDSTVRSWLLGETPGAKLLRSISEYLGQPDHPPGIGPVIPDLQSGSFAVVSGTDWGVVKIQTLDDEESIISLFGGPGSVEERRVDTERLTAIEITPETRCYIYDSELYAWKVGRIQSFDPQSGTYLIDLPDRNFANHPPEQVEVRSAELDRDPVSVLRERGHETAYFHDRRSAFTHALTSQRALTRGMSGLVSSRIRLYPHQVSVARRVLLDAFPRYILADEVGLGKTIEAGIIARQHILDDSEASVTIVCPDHLKNQWMDEWMSKFALRTREHRVDIVSYQDVDASESPSMLIVDEAHNLGRQSDKEWDAVYENVKQLSKTADTVLLLTATPSALSPEGLFRLLHIIDPVAYREGEVDAFRKRVEIQEEIGEALSSIRSENPSFIIKDGLEKLNTVLPNDELLRDYSEKVVDLITEDENSSSSLSRAISELREHVKETYRLYQRLVRHRRENVESDLVDRADGKVTREFSLDVRENDFLLTLENWRQYASASETDQTDFARLYVLLAQLGGASMELLSDALRYRIQHDLAEKDWMTEKDRRLLRIEHFEGEKPLLRQMIEIADAKPDVMDLTRIQITAQAALKEMGKGKRVVVFSTRPEVAKNIATNIEQDTSSDDSCFISTVLGSTEGGAETVRNLEKAPCGVLVMDHTGEDGLNLQFADVLIHADFPFNPNRLEQRTGRLDRLGRDETFDTHVPVGPENEDVMLVSPRWAWYKVVDEAFRLFQESTASLQFFFDEKMPELMEGMFKNGPQWLVNQIEKYKEEIEEERSRIRKQDLLNTLDESSQESDSVWDDLQTAEDEWSEVFGSMHSILAEVWQFSFETQKNGVSYQMGQQTLLPLDVQLDRFLELTERPITGRRPVCSEAGGSVDLARPGTAWIRRIREYQKWDDRGHAYALWRLWREEGRPSHVTEDPWWGFVYEVIVEANIKKVVEQEEGGVRQPIHTLRRRGDGIFPPSVHSVVVNQHGDVVTDSRIRQSALAELDRDLDTNLHKHRVEAIDDIVPYGWGKKCRKSHEIALEHVLNDSEVQGAVSSAQRRISLNRRQVEYRQRRRAEMDYNIGDHQMKQLDMLETAVSSPHARVDAAGFVVLSDQPYDS